MASSSGNENNQNTVDSAHDERIIRNAGILEYLRTQRKFVEPPIHDRVYSKEDPPVVYTSDPKVRFKVVGGVKKKCTSKADVWTHNDIMRYGRILNARAEALRADPADVLVPQKPKEEGLPEKQQGVQ